MPKLPSLKPKQIIKFLKSHDFTLDHTTGSHFIFYNEKTKRRAVVPKHNSDIPKGTLVSILREAGFTRQDIIHFLKL